MRLNQNVLIVIANCMLVISVMASAIDYGVREKLSQISPDEEAHARVTRSFWLSMDSSAVLGRRRRLMQTTGEFVNDLKTLLSGKMPFVKAVPTSTPAQEGNPAVTVTPGLSELQLKKLLRTSATEKKGYLDNAVKKAITKKMNAGSLAAGAIGMLWPGPLAPVVSALLAPIVSDYVANKNKKQ